MVRRQQRERPRLFGPIAAAAALVAAIALTSIGAAGSFARGFRSSVDLGSGEPGVAQDEGELLIALPFLNRGTRSASDVRLEAVSLRAHDLLAPETLPLALGDLEGGEKRVLQLAFAPTGPSARGPTGSLSAALIEWKGGGARPGARSSCGAGSRSLFPTRA